MAVDENGIEIVDGENAQSLKFIANNKEFNTPEEAQAELRAMESSLMRGYEEKLSKERQARETALQEDVNFYATHDPSEWDNYLPKLKYGDKGGYQGTAQPVAKPSTVQNNNQPAFTDPNAVKNLEERLRSLEGELMGLKAYDDDRAKADAVTALNASLRKFNLADANAVKLEMEKYWAVNGKHHPTPDIVNQIVEKSHKRTLELVNKAGGNKPVDNPNPPVVTSGGVAGSETGKRPSLRTDPEGFKKHVADKLAGLFTG